MWTRKELKEKAKSAFKTNYWRCVIAALILTALIGGVSLAGGIGAGSAGSAGSIGSTTESANEEALDLSGDTLNINGVEIDLDTIDGAGVTEALNAVSEGLTSGKLNINGQDIDISDAEAVEELKDAINSISDTDLSEYSHEDLGNLATGVLAAIGGVLLFIVIITVLIKIFVFNPLVVGCEGFFTVNSREKADLGEIKRGFSPRWMHNVGTMLLKDIFLCLWSMLFVIPGLIKAYSYAMVPFILADNPDLGATEAITLSRKMMNGNKWKTFVLDLSFIGWELLSLITCGIVGVFYVNPYIYATYAELYNSLKGVTAE